MPKLKQKLEDVLAEQKLISKAQLELIKLESVKTGRPIDDILNDLKLIKDEDLVRARSVVFGMPYVDLTGKSIPQQVLRKVPYDYARDYQTAAFAESPSDLSVAMVDPTNVRVLDFLEKKVGVKLKPFMASSASVQNGISQYQRAGALEVSEVLKRVEIPDTTEQKEVEDIQSLVADAPVTTAVNSILQYANKSRASDIHIEPKENTVRIRYRIDGILHEAMEIPKNVHPAIVSRIKILSNLKIDEHRIPQDGQFQVKVGDKEIDVRVALSPQITGEKVVLRLLDKTGGTYTLADMGMVGYAYRIVEAGVKQPHGMTLVTGPTGSGKTTTLNGFVKALNTEGVNIITIEDPVEYQVDGVNQIQVNNKVGLTFAAALRSVLRQDPNIIMVGEIRDQETAELAVHASLTGHVVLSTLHTNNAAGILPRLLDMGIEPYLIGSTLSTAIAQRLVRKICNVCKASFGASPAAAQSIKKTLGGLLPKASDDSKRKAEIAEYLGYDDLPDSDAAGYTLYKGAGCQECAGTGFQGRIAVFEVFQMTEEMESLIISRPTTQQVMEQALKQGMITMKQDGYMKALTGITTLDEVARVTTD